MSPINILFVHQNFPGQFRHVARTFADEGHRVVALMQGSAQTVDMPGIKVFGYSLKRGNTPGIHPLAEEFESKVLRGDAAAVAARSLKDQGFIPDVIFAHPGWGETLYLKDVFPNARLVCLMEYFYNANGQDIGFDPEFATPPELQKQRLHTKNANLLLAMQAMDIGIAATQWQASTLPDWAQAKTRVLHEGIDTGEVSPNRDAELSLPDRKIRVRPGDEVLTFVARNLDPVRGYHQFMRALPAIMAARPNAQVFIVGADGGGYGQRPSEGSYRDRYLKEVAHLLDPARVHFLGQVPRAVFLSLMQISRCHVYLTYPFVLSWSMLEAMSAGALVVGSDTPPVREVIRHNYNGLLVNFFDPSAIASTIIDVLGCPDDFETLRHNARKTIVDNYDLNSFCLPGYRNVLHECVDISHR